MRIVQKNRRRKKREKINLYLSIVQWTRVSDERLPLFAIAHRIAELTIVLALEQNDRRANVPHARQNLRRRRKNRTQQTFFLKKKQFISGYECKF
jgi:hypothetical protein